MPLCTVAVTFAAYFDFLRGLESGWNQDVVSSSRRRVSCLDCLNLDLVPNAKAPRPRNFCFLRNFVKIIIPDPFLKKAY